MSFEPAPIFISYSRSDGREFAEAFERRLAAEGIHAWRDLKSMGAGDIRPQVLRAIEEARHLVLILSRRALVSDWIKREWSHARLMGKRVSPVLADVTLTRSDLPVWIRREEVFDIDPARDRDEERWKALVLTLRGDGLVKRTPYMPGDISANFQPRPSEYQALKNAVLAEIPKGTVGLTTALLGAGGYGKTMLANKLCRDDDVRFEFSGGILRVEIGKDRADVTALVADLIEKLDPDGRRPGFADVVTASEHLGELLGESRVLLVIDDVWREAQLRPFLRGGPNCVRLVTTRLPGVLPPDCVAVLIDEMRAAEAASLIAASLPTAEQPESTWRLAALATKLGNWAQMLAIANGWLRDRVAKGETVADAIERFERRLAKNGPFMFDPKEETDRNKAIRLCIAASVDDLDTAEAARFTELAVLPEDEEVPLSVVEALWAGTGKFDEDETEDLLCRLDALSLLQRLNLKQGARTLRLHDNLLWYLRDKLGTAGLRAAHAAILRALGACCGNRWDELPPENRYGWRFLIRHLRSAGEDAAADHLLTDYPWVKSKLYAAGARELLESYVPENRDQGVRLVGRAIALAVPALTVNKRELARQIFGRLGTMEGTAASALVASARVDADFHPAPRWPGLTHPGAELLRLVGHDSELHSAAFSPQGDRVVTASLDSTARIWDAATGEEIAVLRGSEPSVNNAAFSPQGDRIVTASSDETARIWDVETKVVIATLRSDDKAHTLLDRGERSAAFSPKGDRIVTASSNSTARIWDVATSREIAILPGHEHWVRSAAFSADGTRIVTASDRVARIWDATSRKEIAVLHGHESAVNSAAFSPHGDCVATASWDNTARIWDAATWKEVGALRGHGNALTSAAFSPLGDRIVTASRDGTARIWDARTREEIAVLRGHDSGLSGAAFSPQGDRIVTASADHTARIWDTIIGNAVAVPKGHVGRVNSIAFSPMGERILTTSWDETARIWNAVTGDEIAVLLSGQGLMGCAAFSPNGDRVVAAPRDSTARIWDVKTREQVTVLNGHENLLNSAVFSPQGDRVVTASFDKTARIWDATSGEEIAVLRGHRTPLYDAVFSPNGKRVATASADGTRLWDPETAKELADLSSGLTYSTAFSSKGDRIVTASYDNTARIWDATTGRETAVLRGHENAVNKAAFSLKGNRIVTASWDRTARIWDAASGVEVAQIALDAEVTGLSVHGSAIALGDWLGRIHVFDAETLLG